MPGVPMVLDVTWQIRSDPLTLSQPGGQIMTTTLLFGSSGFSEPPTALHMTVSGAVKHSSLKQFRPKLRVL